MQAVLGLFLFSVLLARASSLECEVCNNIGKTCTGKAVICDNRNDVCLHIVTEEPIGSFHVDKRCEQRAVCETLKNLKGKTGTGQYAGKINEILCNKAPSSYASLLLAFTGLLLKTFLF